MGIYLNPNNENFKAIISREIYVDKTMLIAAINRFMDRDNKYICISRPRRFGKTMASEMLSAYYSKGCDSSGIFKAFQIASDETYEEKRNHYNVIKLDINSEYQNVKDKNNLINIISEKVKEELKAAFSDVTIKEEDSLAEAILNIHALRNETFVIILDEYDVLVREKVSKTLFNTYLGFLNGLFKSATLRPAISLAYLTGILPIARDKVQSKLNNFAEYTIIDADGLSEYVGFTDDEVRALCEGHGIDYKQCRLWYDGYKQHGYEIYNPESVVQSIERKRFDSYWGITSTYEAIAELIRMNFKGTRDSVIRMLAGESIPVKVNRFRNMLDSFTTAGDIFTYLIHLGYLSYDIEDKSCRIPNKEVSEEWVNAIEAESEYEITNQIVQESKALLRATIEGDEVAVAKALDQSHMHVTSNRGYNNEDALQSAIYLAYIYALNEYTIIREMTAGKGFADVTFIPVHEGNPAMIIELKRNSSSDSALNQIKERKYYDSLTHYQGDLIFVGINYDEKDKTHICAIERFEKEI